VQAGTSIVLTWTDNSAGEDGFRIERKESGGEFAEIASVNANQTTYTDSGLMEGVTYSYKVKAYNSAAQSAYSNESQPVRISDGNGGGGGGGGGGCSVRTVHNTETAIADTLFLFVPAIIIFVARKYKR
jgi:hypothetical protein